MKGISKTPTNVKMYLTQRLFGTDNTVTIATFGYMGDATLAVKLFNTALSTAHRRVMKYHL